jgi:hypothetical protein
MGWRWRLVKSVREKLRDQLAEVNRRLVRAAEVPPVWRGDAWHAEVDALLSRREALVVQVELGFMITDNRKVRG